MSNLKLIALLAVLVSFSLVNTGCRKRSSDTSAASTSGTSSAPQTTDPASAPAPAAKAPAPVPALSTKDEKEIRKRYVPSDIPWASRTPAQKQMAYFGWCQIYMLGDAATKAKVLAEINQTGLSAEDREALKKQNRSMNIPLMPL
jgi:hypothetical protein